MKQELDLSTLLEPTESSSSKRDTTQKRRHIKKDAAVIELQRQKKLAREAKRKLSKQEKIRLQKEKNRFHAQKSRDDHKQYVNSLEREVKMLREELERSRYYCSHCKKTIESTEQKQGNNEQPINLEHFGGDEIAWKQDNFAMNEDIVSKGETSFLRLFEQKQDHHLLKMVLFVAAILIAVLFVHNPLSAGHSELGMTLPTIQKYYISQNRDESFMKQHQNETLHHSQIQQREGQNIQIGQTPYLHNSNNQSLTNKETKESFNQDFTELKSHSPSKNKQIEETKSEAGHHIFVKKQAND